MLREGQGLSEISEGQEQNQAVKPQEMDGELKFIFWGPIEPVSRGSNGGDVCFWPRTN